MYVVHVMIVLVLFFEPLSSSLRSSPLIVAEKVRERALTNGPHCKKENAKNSALRYRFSLYA